MSLPHPDRDPLRRALAGLVEVKGNAEECPPAALIWESGAGNLERRRDAAVIRHIGECSACGVAWELARDLAPAVPLPAVVPDRRPAWRFALAAAGVVTAAALGMWFYAPWGPATAPATYRDAADRWLVSKTSANRALPRNDVVLRWAAGPAGTTYDVTVTGERLEPLARAWRLERPEYRLAPADLADLTAGATIFWRVTAHLPDGREVRSLTFVNAVE